MIVRTATANLIAALVPLAIGLVTVPIVLSEYGAERFGILAMALVLLGYFGLLDLGLGRATTRFASRLMGLGELAEARQVISSSIKLTLGVGVFAGLLLLFAWTALGSRGLGIPPSLMKEADLGIIAVVIAIPLSMLSNTLQGSLEAAKRFGLVNTAQACISILGQMVPIALIPVAKNVGVCLLALSVLKAIHVGILLVGVTSAFGSVLPRRDVSRDMSFFHYSGWIFVTNMVSPLLVNVDRVMIGHLLSVAAVAHFAVPFTLVSKVWWLPTALCRVLFPYFGGASSSSQQSLYRTASEASRYLIVVVGIAIIPLVAMASEILNLWVGDELPKESSVVLQILALGVWINSVAHVPYAFIQAQGRADVPAKFHLLEAFIYLPGIWLLIRSFGITGAALGWTLRVCLDFVLLAQAQARLASGNGIRLSNKGILPGMLCAGVIVGLAIAISIMPSGPIVRGAAAGVLVSVWMVVGTAIFLTRQELSLLKTRVEHLLGRLPLLGRRVGQDTTAT